MRQKIITIGIIGLSCVVLLCSSGEKAESQPEQKPYDMELMYDENQPQPPVVTPPVASIQEKPGKAPSDAIVLFDGTDLSQWENEDGSEPEWIVENGYVQVVKGKGKIFTKKEFGSCQLHVEWASAGEVSGDGQRRGNSGIFMMNMYEVQILDSYNNRTYPPGSAGAIYAQKAPLVNATLPPGEWQSYDIIFHRPFFENGKVVKPATVTVLHNGILVQDHYEITGRTKFKTPPVYEEHPAKMHIALQDHNNPIRYRNIWIREIED